MDTLSDTGVLVGNKAINTASNGFALAQFDGNIWGNLADGVVGQNVEMTEPAINTISVAALRRDTTADELGVFLSGVAADAPETDITTGTANATSGFSVGAASGGSYHFNGKIYAVAFWRRYLTDVEVLYVGERLTAVLPHADLHDGKILEYLTAEFSVTCREVVGALNEVNGTVGVEYLKARRDFIGGDELRSEA